jgi:hypothetical protein
VPEKELNLVKLSSGIMAESRTRSAEIVRCKARDIHSLGGLLDDVPDRFL